MFPLTPDEKARQEMNNRLRNFTQSMIDLVYWYHEPLLEAYKKIEQLENRNHELRKELEEALSKLAAAQQSAQPTDGGLAQSDGESNSPTISG